MTADFKFPTDTCVLVCSGPSLNLVDPFKLGVPVVVISTAIRVITNPHYWILADYLNEMHGQEGNTACQNENILKIIPKNKINKKHDHLYRNYIEIDYTDSDRYIKDTNTHLFSGNLPLLKGPHKSVTFGIQWLHYVGVKNVIWVGNDLNAISASEKYAYESTKIDLGKSHNYNITLDQVHKSLKDWYPKAKDRGYVWYSWKCGDIFEKIVPQFDENAYIYPENSIFYSFSANSVNDILPVDYQKTPPVRISKEERRKLQKFRKDNIDSVAIKAEKKKENQIRIKNQIINRKLENKEKREERKFELNIIKTQKTSVSPKKTVRYVSIPRSKEDILNDIKKIKDSLR